MDIRWVTSLHKGAPHKKYSSGGTVKGVPLEIEVEVCPNKRTIEKVGKTEVKGNKSEVDVKLVEKVCSVVEVKAKEECVKVTVEKKVVVEVVVKEVE